MKIPKLNSLNNNVQNKIFISQSSRNFSTSKSLVSPTTDHKEESKWSISTPSAPDIDPSKLNNPVFESDKLNADENIRKELKDLNYPKDSKIVDEVVEKHMKIRNEHIAAYEKELREDASEEIKVIRRRRIKDEISDPEIDRFIRKKDKEVREELREHSQHCEKENEMIRANAAHYKETHCNQTPEAENTSKPQSPLDYVLEKQKSELPDIPDSDGGGE
jgi:hypothetical protein